MISQHSLTLYFIDMYNSFHQDTSILFFLERKQLLPFPLFILFIFLIFYLPCLGPWLQHHTCCWQVSGGVPTPLPGQRTPQTAQSYLERQDKTFTVAETLWELLSGNIMLGKKLQYVFVPSNIQSDLYCMQGLGGAQLQVTHLTLSSYLNIYTTPSLWCKIEQSQVCACVFLCMHVCVLHPCMCVFYMYMLLLLYLRTFEQNRATFSQDAGDKNSSQRSNISEVCISPRSGVKVALQ